MIERFKILKLTNQKGLLPAQEHHSKKHCVQTTVLIFTSQSRAYIVAGKRILIRVRKDIKLSNIKTLLNQNQ